MALFVQRVCKDYLMGALLECGNSNGKAMHMRLKFIELLTLNWKSRQAPILKQLTSPDQNLHQSSFYLNDSISAQPRALCLSRVK